MKYDQDLLETTYDRTDGRCHICRKKLSFSNYARFEFRGAWEVEHSVPRHTGGTNYLNNLYPACISCNRSKGIHATRSVRGRFGYTRAPLSAAKKEQARTESGIAGAVVGALVGLSTGGAGAVVCGIVGLCLGYSIEPE